MGDMIYRPLIEDMTWSYSRIRCFNDCPYRWYMQYIAGTSQEPRFYSSYGSFIHKILEQYYKGKLKKEDMVSEFLLGLSDEVLGTPPSEKIAAGYVESGVNYFKNFEPVQFRVLDVEKRINNKIDGTPFVGIVDLVCEDDDGLVIVDHKSRALKPRSNKKKPTLNDKEIDEMLRQLYLYAAGIKDRYGEFPKKLCFNCFRSGELIVEPFVESAFHEAVEWAKESIDIIMETERFAPHMDFFSCRNICGFTEKCVYFEDWG